MSVLVSAQISNRRCQPAELRAKRETSSPQHDPGAAHPDYGNLNIANIKKAISILNLTSGTTYAFQAQALSMLGLSA